MSSFGFVFRKRYERPARRLRNIRISEVSSVDKGAGTNCEVVLTKRADHVDHSRETAMGYSLSTRDLIAKSAQLMPSRQFIDFCKNAGLSKADAWQAIEDRAFARYPNEPSRAIAVTKYITEADEGIEAYAFQSIHSV
jgi:hypothetical protein